MLQRSLAVVVAYLMPEQADAAADELRRQAEATARPELKELLADSAESLSLPAAVRSLPDLTSKWVEVVEVALWLTSTVLAQLTPAQAEKAAADLRQQADSVAQP